MCVERFTVSVSSPALSFLMYDCANRDTDFEGLIFGSVTTRQVCDVSDEANSDTTVKEITEVCIQRFVFLEARFSFYEPNLNVNSDLIHMLLQTLSTSIENVSVLGWFRLKRNVGPVGFSRIERRVTASLSSITDASKDGLRTPLFMLLSESVENKHDYGETGYQLFQYDPHFCRFRPIRLIVTNIGSTNQAEYQQSPLAFGAPSLSIIPHSIADFPSTVYNYASTLMQNSMTQLKTICQSLSAKAEQLNKSWLPATCSNRRGLLTVSLAEGFCPSQENTEEISRHQRQHQSSTERRSENSANSTGDKFMNDSLVSRNSAW